MARPGRLVAPPFRTYAVERERNRERVDALRRESPVLHAWSLDRDGTGKKFPLLAALLAAHPADRNEWLLFADDDILLTRGSLRRFVALAQAAELDLAQPGHDRRGHVNFGVTVSRPLTRVRETTFVECGPLFAVSPAARERVTEPFADAGMGWGIERLWFLLDPPIRLGIVDEVRMRHLDQAATAYRKEDALREGEAFLAARGITGWQEHETLRTWDAWTRVR